MYLAAIIIFASTLLGNESAFRLGDISQVVFEESYATNSAKGWGYSAADDLAFALTRVAARKVTAVRESKAMLSGEVSVFVGDTEVARQAGLMAADLKCGEFRIVTTTNRAFIVANTGMAATFGVAEFLQRYADYWFCLFDRAQDPYMTAPKRKVPGEDIRREHWLYARRYVSWGPQFPLTARNLAAEFTRRSRCRSNTELEARELPSPSTGYCHSYYHYVQPEKYAKAHPEYYTLGIDGKRHFVANAHSELCLSNPELLEVVYTNLCAMIESDRTKYGSSAPCIYDFSQMDNCDHLCYCDQCRKVIAKYNRKQGGHAEGGDAGLQLEFVNALARRIRDKYPEVIIRTFAYVSTEVPPKSGTIIPEDNVMIWLCDLYSKCDDMLPLEHNFNRSRRQLIEEWHALAKHLEIWDYYLSAGEFPQLDAIAADAKYFRRLGLKRIYTETRFSNHPFYQLQRFVTSQLYFDADQNLETLIAKWCRVYGSGAKAMKAAIDFQRGLLLKYPPQDAAAWHDRVLPFLTVANMEKSLAMFKTAYQAAEIGRCRARIAHPIAATAKRLMKMYRANGDDANYARVKGEYLRFANEALSGMILAPKELSKVRGSITSTIELMELEFTDLPEELKTVPKKDLHFIDYHHLLIDRRNCQEVAGASAGGKGYRWVPSENKLPPFNCSMLDEITPFNHHHQFNPIPDGQWHWYKIAIDWLGRGGWVGLPYVGDNSIAFKVQHLYRECDGMANDPNWYEIWISAKWGGELLNPEKGLVVDRLILHRVTKPTQ